MTLAAATLCAALVSGCGFPPGNPGILVITTPPGASCTLTRLGQPTATVAPTPAIALIEPTASDITILCRRQGFADTAMTLPAGESGLSFGSVVYGRATSDYQRQVEIVLQPRPPGRAPQ